MQTYSSCSSQRYFKEIEQLTDVVLRQFGHADADIRNAAVYVSQLCAQFGHLVNFVHVLALEEVQTIEVLLIVREENRIL